MTREEIIEHMKVMGQNAANMDEVMMYVMTRKDCEVVMAAAELLEAQEPRIVAISELTSGEPMLVWLEDIDKEETIAGMIFDYVPGRLGFKLTDIASMDRIYPRIEDYLTRWRCWTSRPDQATREATPWE